MVSIINNDYSSNHDYIYYIAVVSLGVLCYSSPHCNMNKKAVYFLGDTHFDSVYSRADRAQIAKFTDTHQTLLTPENWRCYLPLCAKAELMFAGWGMAALNEEVLSCFPRLEAVFYAGGSIKGIVSNAFWKRNIVISAGASANAVPVAEFTVAQIVLAAKHAWRMAADVRRIGTYPPRYDPPGMFDTTVGIVSLGLIGKLVAARLRAFDISVIAYDPIISKLDAEAMGVKLVSLDEVFSKSDIVTCHAPLLAETKEMLRRGHFLKMKAGATFINTARGALVKEADLISVLEERPDLWALLDVTHPEPPVSKSPFYSLPNVVITPHIAGSMGRECFRMGHYMVEEASRYITGEPLRYQVTQEQIAVMA